MPFISGCLLLFFWHTRRYKQSSSLISRLMDILWDTIVFSSVTNFKNCKPVVSGLSVICPEWSLYRLDCSAPHLYTKLCEKKIKKKRKKERKKEREKEREKERKKERKTNSYIACVASVSARIRRECCDESKREAKYEKGGDGEKRKTLILSPSPFFYLVLLSLQLPRNNSIRNAYYSG